MNTLDITTLLCSKQLGSNDILLSYKSPNANSLLSYKSPNANSLLSYKSPKLDGMFQVKVTVVAVTRCVRVHVAVLCVCAWRLPPPATYTACLASQCTHGSRNSPQKLLNITQSSQRSVVFCDISPHLVYNIHPVFFVFVTWY